MNVLHLLWIAPVCWLIGVVTTILGIASKQADFDDDFYEGSVR